MRNRFTSIDEVERLRGCLAVGVGLPSRFFPNQECWEGCIRFGWGKCGGGESGRSRRRMVAFPHLAQTTNCFAQTNGKVYNGF